MTKIQSLLAVLFITCLSFSVSALPTTPKQHVDSEVNLSQLLNSENHSIEDILNLTPKKYKEITGKKMKLGDKIALKLVQRQMRSFESEAAPANHNIDQTILLVLCIIPPLAIYLVEGTSANFWLSCLAILGSIILGVLPLIGGILGFLLYVLAIAHAVLIVLN